MSIHNTAELPILERLKNSELSLKQSEEIARMGTWEWNAVTNISRWSENIYSLYEIENSNIEPSFEYVLSRLHPEDVAAMHAAHAIMNRDKTQVDSEIRIMFPDGRIKWLLNRMIPTYENDQLVLLKGINLDITDRKLAEEAMLRLNAELEQKVIERTNEIRKQEEQYHLLLETMKDGVLYVDNNERIMFANQHFCDMLGYELFEILGQTAPELFLDEEDRQKMQTVSAERRHSVKGSYEIQMKTKSGKKIWMQINGSPVVNEEGKVIGSVGTHSDISQLVQHVRGMEDIIFAISHEVRQPVANIIGMAGLLEKGQMSNEELKKIVIYLKESAETLDIFTKRLTLLVSENKYLVSRQNRTSR